LFFWGQHVDSFLWLLASYVSIYSVVFLCFFAWFCVVIILFVFFKSLLEFGFVFVFVFRYGYFCCFLIIIFFLYFGAMSARGR
jgi:hypothetical protein